MGCDTLETENGISVNARNTNGGWWASAVNGARQTPEEVAPLLMKCRPLHEQTHSAGVSGGQLSTSSSGQGGSASDSDTARGPSATARARTQLQTQNGNRAQRLSHRATHHARPERR
eukprot:6062513-Pleurochrysis_carterae.AAC.1